MEIVAESTGFFSLKDQKIEVVSFFTKDLASTP